MRKNLLPIFALLFLFSTCGAVTFTSKDDTFTLDMPQGWKQVESSQSVLSIKKDNSTLVIKKDNCTTETCIENKTNNDLSQVKAKKMQVVGNSYTGEEIKQIEFSTGEPFFYISFYTPKNDFSSGYFLISGKAYSILATNVSYAETDIFFSGISPKKIEQPVAPKLEIDLKDPRAYSITAMPGVEEQVVEAPKETKKIEARPQVASRNYLKKLKISTLVSSTMPQYVRQLGHIFDGIVILIFGYLLLLAMGLVIRLFCSSSLPVLQANPNSLYPILFKRLYGTPSLIFKAKDNQGNVLISLSSRWDSILMFGGTLCVIIAILVLAACGIVENTKILPMITPTHLDTICTGCSLLIPLGMVLFCCGVLANLLLPREITLFDRKGQRAAVVLQKGFSLTKEQYEIYFARSKEKLLATRKRFSLQRTWHIFVNEDNLLCSIKESSTLKSVLRKLFGHCWGFLRADYQVEGQMESSGIIHNAHSAFNQFIAFVDKPQAINARDMLVVALLINIRDKDKWYPWVN